MRASLVVVASPSGTEQQRMRSLLDDLEVNVVQEISARAAP